jgi:hypothetical protein
MFAGGTAFKNKLLLSERTPAKIKKEDVEYIPNESFDLS